ncbi:MAG: mannose-1-phosphate guanylyltransferase/mannose-6-phosphate isomerase [Hydrogenophilales bacterium CG03_land_8_20_14_0_80_62_28]|nr:mannose-1-phosphate guanylyltransferase/mannose-6-phosphate isomerase [Betaproteobacteria bacterium]OIO78356.1 MAG: mannose-1-phosphate guanylyltransferase/mannose-6-phosphate isomerase [Hydrogenophilaceae bacterium CG1_02_62_390]PIV24209.1 MAG: mannose-1-phosphate guanylyltransferase/mannose-6-phosphate isomerase [Hydrogenophilales bacterium CG03_land_8_20_14_0_80_62_28]PIW37597.1 MAG: mannose-1-phosphate guanylyltransferase/mannose-6-phosphate isomerase [Hydrogenophilales bacterium CG15_BIG
MLIPVILSGGAGTRLWPVSREGRPKPFMRMTDGGSLLGKTYSRALACLGASEVLTITNRDYYFQSKDVWQAETDDRLPLRFLLEPAARNTAPAILLGALMLRAEHGAEAVMLVLAADHLIQDVPAFVADVAEAESLARTGHLVTFGIPPTHPETGFGYIAAGTAIGDGPGCQVVGFIEKPSQERAAEMIAAGSHFWNSGMFCFRVGDLIEAFAHYAPEMLAIGEACWAATLPGCSEAYCALDADTFAGLDDISIDYAIMEKADNVAVVPAGFDWTDVGSWRALADLVEADAAGNRSLGEVIHIGTRNCYVQSEDRLVATVGIDDLVIVDTPDALLISHRDETQRVKEVVKLLRDSGHACYKLHRTVARPWGTYSVLEEADRYKIKRIEVKPGASLSLQMHHHRSEHWIVVSGTARVTNDEQVMLVHSNESTYIPAGHAHRLENPGILNLVMIEVQSGEYLGEDDIVRFEDIYGRG